MSTPADQPADPRIRESGAPWVTASPPAPPGRTADEFADRDRPRTAAPREEDLNHLRLLSIFHYVVGGMLALCATFPVIHLLVGIGLVSGAFKSAPGSPPPPAAMGWMFILIAGGAIALGWAFAICLFVAGYQLRRQRRYLFCLIAAGLACTFQPLGLVLGIFTIIVLLRPSVKALFQQTSESAADPAASSSTAS